MKLSKIVKRLFIFIIVLVILVIGAAIAIPYFFKDEILEKIKQEANATLNAKVDFEDVNLSLLRSFPDFSFEMKNLKMEGVDAFEGVPLVEAEDIDFTLDLMSVIKSDRPIEVQSVTLTKPNVNILILKNGVANYDIVKPSNGNTADTESSGEYDFLIQLKKYTIEDGNFVYDDRAGNIFLELKNLNHTGKGDFTQDVFDLVTKTSISALTAKSGGITYLKKANANLDATFNIDMINSKYTLADNDLKINAMNLLADGWVQLENNDDIKIDFTFNAPKNDFKHLLSLIPSAFTQDFSNVKTGGQMAFNGYVKGTYNGEKERLPAFKIDLDVSNGSFQYPDLPMGMNNIFTKVNIESPSSNLDKMKIDIPDFKLALGGKPFEGRFKLRTPISDPDIDTKVKGTIDLADINKAFPLDGVTQLSGIIDADVVAKTRLSTIEKGDYESANINGDASVKNLVYVADGLPKIIIKESQMTFTPQKAIVKNFDAKLGKSDLQAHGNIDNILAYFSPKKTMTGDLVIRSEYFNVTEWMGEEEAASAATPAPNTAAAETEIFDRFKFKIDAKIGKIDYDVYQLLHSSTTGTFSSNELIINDFQTNLGKSDLSGKGKLTNIFNYVFKNETLGGDLAIRSDFFDLNPFMEEDNSVKTKTIAYNETENLEPLLIPD
ncbi:MAG TPA: AsmA family protein, partial [Phaeodactylibacter sp.]|nr:AsmA family protein [Phaeodactylibacter sp.]